MKNTVTITLEDYKVQALKIYLSEKNSSLDEEISKYAEQLYSRVVPQTVRGFIEMTAKQQNTEKKKTAPTKPTDKP